MKIYIGADHRGYELKAELVNHLKRGGYTVIDEGDERLNQDDDFPQFAAKTVNSVLSSKDKDPRGILLCGSGQGMCIAANRFKGIRAALGWSRDAARSSRNDDDSNVLCLPADVLKEDVANLIVETWLNTPFASATRFKRRNSQLDQLT